MADQKESIAPPAAPSFEEAIDELEELTERLAHEPKSLGALIDDFERGQSLIQFCHGALKSARERINVIQASLQNESEDDALDDSSKSFSDVNDDVRHF